MSTRDEDVFFEILAGRHIVPGDSPSAARLALEMRRQILARNGQVLPTEADAALSAEELIGRFDRTFEEEFALAPQLVPALDMPTTAHLAMPPRANDSSSEAAPSKPTRGVAPTATRPSVFERLRVAFWGDDWLRPVAFASVLGFGLLIGKQITPPQAELGKVAERRVDAPAELTLIATDAGAEANTLVERLTKEGLQAQAVQIGLQPPRWTIRVTAESDADQAKARQVLLGEALSKRQLRVDVIQVSTPAAASGAASR